MATSTNRNYIMRSWAKEAGYISGVCKKRGLPAPAFGELNWQKKVVDLIKFLDSEVPDHIKGESQQGDSLDHSK